MRHAFHLAGRFAPDLTRRLHHQPEAVHVALGQVATAGVEREPAIGPRQVLRRQEPLRLLGRAEAVLHERHDHTAGEVLVRLDHLNVGGADAGHRPEAAGERAEVGGSV